MKESDLYPPLKHFLQSQDYEVKGEVNGCDVLAVRAQETPVIVELKLSLNLDVILQAVDRILLSPNVYIGVPSDCKALKRKRKRIIKLLKMLGLGLMTINYKKDKGLVKVLLDPGTYRPKQSKYRQTRLLAEFTKRHGDPNLGGTATKMGIMTAYRQSAIAIAKFLQEHGPSKASHVSAALDEPKARSILYRNVYGWFEKESRGIYTLSQTGRKQIEHWSGAVAAH